VAFSSAGFLSLITASGRPLTNTNRSGRRCCCPSHHGELVDRQPVVGAGLVEVDQASLGIAYRAIGAAELHRDSIHQEAVGGPVLLDQRRGIEAEQPADGILQGLGRQAWVEADKGGAEAALQQHVAPVRVAALGSGLAGRQVGAIAGLVAQGRQPAQGSVLHDRLGEGAHGWVGEASAVSMAWITCRSSDRSSAGQALGSGAFSSGKSSYR